MTGLGIEYSPCTKCDKTKCSFCELAKYKNSQKGCQPEERLYAARDTNTGKLVSDITYPKRKYWDKRGNAIKAIDYYNRLYANRKLKYSCNKGEHGTLELVTFELVEVENNGNTLEK